MPEALGDTGPLLHLHEIGELSALTIFERIDVPPLVAEELERLGVGLASPALAELGLLALAEVEESEWRSALAESLPSLQAADAQVLTLARRRRFEVPVLTDDLALRSRIESEGGTAVGSLGVLVRNYRLALFHRDRLEAAAHRLMSGSTLHMSRPFRRYVERLIAEL